MQRIFPQDGGDNGSITGKFISGSTKKGRENVPIWSQFQKFCSVRFKSIILKIPPPGGGGQQRHQEILFLSVLNEGEKIFGIGSI